MASFQQSLAELVGPLDPTKHAAELVRLRHCRSLADLAAIAAGDGWLTVAAQKKRLKLVKHGSGTYLVVEYEDGWSKRVSMALFQGAR